jgi:uncharacterized protein YndB with AHSA1/START domain
MRYADSPTTEVDVLVHAPIERIWELVTDIELPAQFSTEFQGAEWIDAGPAVAARFKGRNQHPAGGTWETTSIVTRYDPPTVFEWAVGEAEHPSATWRFELAPKEGAIRLTQWCQIGPGPSGLTPAIVAMPDKEERIVARRLDEFRASMRATVEGIKQLAEADR